MRKKSSKKSEKKTLLIDTSVLIAFLVKNDPYHKRAVEDLKDVDILLVPAEALVETALFFRRHGISFRFLRDFILSREVRVVDTTEDDIAEALRITEGRPEFFVDYVIYNASLRLGVPFLTYDEKFLEWVKE